MLDQCLLKMEMQEVSMQVLMQAAQQRQSSAVVQQQPLLNGTR